jgi:hypothetical protein
MLSVNSEGLSDYGFIQARRLSVSEIGVISRFRNRRLSLSSMCSDAPSTHSLPISPENHVLPTFLAKKRPSSQRVENATELAEFRNKLPVINGRPTVSFEHLPELAQLTTKSDLDLMRRDGIHFAGVGGVAQAYEDVKKTGVVNTTPSDLSVVGKFQSIGIRKQRDFKKLGIQTDSIPKSPHLSIGTKMLQAMHLKQRFDPQEVKTLKQQMEQTGGLQPAYHNPQIGMGITPTGSITSFSDLLSSMKTIKGDPQSVHGSVLPVQDQLSPPRAKPLPTPAVKQADIDTVADPLMTSTGQHDMWATPGGLSPELW